MPPNSGIENSEPRTLEKLVAPQVDDYKFKISKETVALLVTLHVSAIYGLYLIPSVKWATLVFGYVVFVAAQVGACAGYHRLYAHCSFKANTPLQIILIAFSCLAHQYSGFAWARDHRMHHRFCDTDADPYNSTRGFMFCHIGWLAVHKHPKLKERAHMINITDLYENKLLMFQVKYNYIIVPLLTYILPTIIPVYFWGEDLKAALFINLLRYVLNLHSMFSINSIAHMWGTKAYETKIQPAQNVGVSIATLGEGFHNYHHVFPWSYRAAELGNNWLNWSALFIDFFAWIGWAYDLKTVPDAVVKKRMQRTGDGTDSWGWGLRSLHEEDTKSANILYERFE